MAMGDGKHMLPVRADTRQAIRKEVEDIVTVALEERFEKRSGNAGLSLKTALSEMRGWLHSANSLSLAAIRPKAAIDFQYFS